MRSSIFGSGVHVHATATRSPELVSHVLSCSRGSSPPATRRTTSRTPAASAGSTNASQKTCPPISSGAYPSASSNARFAPTGRDPAGLVDEAEHARGVLGDRVQERTLTLLLELEPPPLRDLDPGHQHERLRAPGHVRDRHGPPRERTHAPVGAAQFGLDFVGGAPARRRRDRVLRGRRIVLGDEVEERAAHELVVAPAERVPEGAVRADARVLDVAVANDPVAVEDDGDARDRLQRGRGRVAFALEVELALAPLGDVEPTGDDAEHAVGGVLHGRRAPVDRPLLASRVRERVLVLAGAGSPARERGTARSSPRARTGR